MLGVGGKDVNAFIQPPHDIPVVRTGETQPSEIQIPLETAHPREFSHKRCGQGFLAPLNASGTCFAQIVNGSPDEVAQDLRTFLNGLPVFPGFKAHDLGTDKGLVREILAVVFVLLIAVIQGDDIHQVSKGHSAAIKLLTGEFPVTQIITGTGRGIIIVQRLIQVWRNELLFSCLGQEHAAAGHRTGRVQHMDCIHKLLQPVFPVGTAVGFSNFIAAGPDEYRRMVSIPKNGCRGVPLPPVLKIEVIVHTAFAGAPAVK